MIPLKTLFQHLARPEVTEVAMVSGRHPFARVSGSLEVLDADVLTSDDILQLLFNAGGSRYVDSLGPKAVQWATRAEGLGAVLVAALQKGDAVQARFTLKNRESGSADPGSSNRATPVMEEAPRRAERPAQPPPAPIPAPVITTASKARVGSESPAPLMGSSETSFDFQLDDQRPPSTPASPLPRVAPINAPPSPPPIPRAAPIAATPPPLVPRAPSVPASSTPTPPPLASAPPTLSTRGRRATLDDPFGDAVVRAPGLAARSASPPPRPPSVPAPTVSSAREAPPTAPTGTPRPPSSETRAVPPSSGLRPGSSPREPGRLPPSASLAPRDAERAVTRPAKREPVPNEPVTGPSLIAQREAPPLVVSNLRSPGPGHHSRVFRDLLLSARNAHASDLHIVAQRKPLLRISGELIGRGNPLDPELCEHMILERVPPRLLLQLERDGSCDFALEDQRAGRFRVNVTRQRTGFKASLRLIDQEIPTLATLGLPDAIGLATHHHQGLIVLTGPTGHGKTTTLAALVDILNSGTTRHIITVEDPVEYLHPRKMALMSQREVGTHTRSFASALKGSLREDPDVIVVGELRDTETVRMALSASETGHLVIGTMNTPSAAKTIDRLIDLFPPGDQQQVRITLAGGLRLIVSQRLLPRSEGPGMVAAAEVLPGSTALWNLIRDNKTFQIPSLQQRGKGLGILRLDDSLAELVRAGKTSAEAAIRLAEAPEELAAVLAGKRGPAVAPGAAPPPAVPPAPSSDAGAPTSNLKGLFNKAGALLGKRGS
jgi:twitching motility protein PilT